MTRLPSEPHLPHLEPSEILFFLWGEAEGDGDRIRRHLGSCDRCRREAEELQSDLVRLGPPEVPEPDDLWERRLARRLDPRLARVPRRGGRRWRWLAAAAVIAAAAVGMVLMIDHQPDPDRPLEETTAGRQAVRLATAEHLGQTQGLLVAVANDEGHAEDRLQLAAWAEDALASNRLCRLTADGTLDEETLSLLTGLEALLAELANLEPADDDAWRTVRTLADRGDLLPRLRLVRLRLDAPRNISPTDHEHREV